MSEVGGPGRPTWRHRLGVGRVSLPLGLATAWLASAWAEDPRSSSGVRESEARADGAKRRGPLYYEVPPPCTDVVNDRTGAADLTIAGIRLGDRASLHAVTGRNEYEEFGGCRFTTHPDEEAKPTERRAPKKLGEACEDGCMIFVNKDRREILVLRHAHGDYWDEHVAYVVRSFPAGMPSDLCHLERVEHFTTGRGIHLGMDRKQVTQILGKPRREKVIGSKSGSSIRFTLRTACDSEYEATYRFREEKLVEFSAGFPVCE